MPSQVKYSKYHALGNDYFVITPENVNFELTPERIGRICHPNFGVGSDRILFGSLPSKRTRFTLRIFNPDGSEAEKSGNGLVSVVLAAAHFSRSAASFSRLGRN
jgi:diaminopimelate epimerase